jgi:hypothetical protein
MLKNPTDELTELIAANLDGYSGFLIALSGRYSVSEWNAALRKAVAVRAASSCRLSPAEPDRRQPSRKDDPSQDA